MFEVLRQAANDLLAVWRGQAGLRELSLLSDHHLADLGLRREQLPTLQWSEPRARKQRSSPQKFRPELVVCG